MMTKLLTALLLTLMMLPARPATAATYTVDGTTLRATEGESPRWEISHAEVGSARLHGPVEAGAQLWYCIAASLYRVEAATGVVSRRVYLPGPCQKVEADGAGVRVTVGSDDPPRPWSASYHVDDASPEVPFFLSSQGVAAMQTRRDARDLLKGVLAAAGQKPKQTEKEDWWRGPDLHPYLEQTLPLLERRAAQDPTNPWFHFLRAQYLDELGRKEEGKAAIEAVMAVDPAYDLDLLAMVRPLDELAPEQAEKAWDRAIRFLLARGYEPELMTGLIGMVVYYGTAGDKQPLDPVKDLERLERFGVRLWDLAPMVEGAAGFYQALSEAHAKAGNADKAHLWAERAHMALPFRMFGGANLEAERAGYALTVIVASMLALILAFIVKTLRNIGVAGGTRRWNLVGRWTRLEIVGFLLLYPVLVVATDTAVRGVGAIGAVAAAPISLAQGNLGHPESLAYWSKVGGSPGADFVQALALHQAGDLEAAASRYATSPLAEAKVNLGVIRAMQGRADEARALYQQAFQQQPGLGEAAFNLGQAADSPRAERAKRLGLTGPLLAMPTVESWSEAWMSRVSQGDLPTVSEPGRFFGGMLNLVGNLDALGGLEELGIFSILLLVGALVGLVLPRKSALEFKPTLASRVGWGLGLVVPGTARQLGLVGPLLLVLFLSSGLFAWHLAQTGGVAAHILDAIAMPSFDRYFGISSPVSGALADAAKQLASGWWAIWLLNVGLVLGLERIAPDPAGPWSGARREG